MRSGHVYEPTSQWAPAIGATDGSALLGTPTTAISGRSAEFRRGAAPNPQELAALLPTPVVNDMGAGKTIEEWDTWTDEMKAKHGNSNGHGPSLSIEVQRLLPTPRAQNGEARNMKP